MAVGLVLIGVGSIGIVINLVYLVVVDSYFGNTSGSGQQLRHVGCGLWSGLVCLVSGCLIWASHRQKVGSRCEVVVWTLLLFVAACSCLTQLVVAVATVVDASTALLEGCGSCRVDLRRSDLEAHLPFDDDSTLPLTSCSVPCVQVFFVIAVEGLLLILAMFGVLSALKQIAASGHTDSGCHRAAQEMPTKTFAYRPLTSSHDELSDRLQTVSVVTSVGCLKLPRTAV